MKPSLSAMYTDLLLPLQEIGMGNLQPQVAQSNPCSWGLGKARVEHTALNGISGYLKLSVFFSDLISSPAREICPFSSAYPHSVHQKAFSFTPGHKNIPTCFQLTFPWQLCPLASPFSLLSRLLSRLFFSFPHLPAPSLFFPLSECHCQYKKFGLSTVI